MIRWKVVAFAAAVAVDTASAQGLAPSSQIPFLEAEVRRDSNDAQLHYRLGIAYWSRKRFDEAERSLRTAVTIERRFAAAYLALGYLPYGRRRQLLKEEMEGRVPPEWRNQATEAARLRRLAFLIDPLVDLQILGAVIPIRESSIAIGGRRVVLDPFAAFVRGDYESAYDVFTSWIVAGLKDPSRDSIPDGLLWYRGLSAGHVRQYEVGIGDFRALLDRYLKAERDRSTGQLPLTTNDYRYILALFKHRARQHMEAIALYKDALASDLGLFMAHVQLGRIYEEQKSWSNSVEHFRSAIATNPDDPSLLLDLGVVLRQAGQLDDSQRTLTQAMDANPRDSRVPYHLGITLQEQGNVAAARDAFTRFVSLAPSRYARQLTDAKQRLATLGN